MHWPPTTSLPLQKTGIKCNELVEFVWKEDRFKICHTAANYVPAAKAKAQQGTSYDARIRVLGNAALGPVLTASNKTRWNKNVFVWWNKNVWRYFCPRNIMEQNTPCIVQDGGTRWCRDIAVVIWAWSLMLEEENTESLGVCGFTQLIRKRRMKRLLQTNYICDLSRFPR